VRDLSDQVESAELDRDIAKQKLDECVGELEHANRTPTLNVQDYVPTKADSDQNPDVSSMLLFSSV
jgi:hypothetical protein